MRRFALCFVCLFPFVFLLSFVSASVFGQSFDAKLYQSMRWRMIGPFRGGRTVGSTGIPNQPNVFYAGVNNGGVWKTTDYGRTWKPIFDQEPTGSIGALAVAPSDPNVIYVGSGEGLHRPDLSIGDGMYKSTDGGKTWRHLGLRDAQQIGAIIVDPKDANRLFVAALGHPYGANAERGVFRSTDGGETFQKVLYKDENTGAIAVVFDPKDSNTIYADLWAAREGPWENGSWQGVGSGLYKSIDGGNSWRQLTKGLPTVEQGLGRIGVTVAPSDSNRLYATVDAGQLGGIYRSDDAGESWYRTNNEIRVWGRASDFAEVEVDPRNPDIVYSANTSVYKSIDGAKTFVAFKGAPGGDDYHRIWINPTNPDIMLVASDQGVVITVNAGETWSSWYNQPTAQFYHVITDDQFPYWVYGGQQESGSAGVRSRGDWGAVTVRDWHPVGAEEYGYVAPDPLHPNLIYGGKLTRFDTETGQTQSVAPEAVRSGKYRFLRTAPLIFSYVDPHTLYYAGNVLFKTTTGGDSWEIISPDLTRERYDIPENIGVFRKPEMATMPRRGVIYTIAPSHKNANVIWVGTDDGLIHVTRDGGKNWQNVTPQGLTSWSKVSLIDSSHFDDETAYAAINRFRLDDLRPHILRTHDGGKTWQEITRGLPDNAPVNAVREDPERKGLLFCGTETGVYVSFNDGDFWQPLRLNMPATSIRDLVIHKDDLVVGTHGRSFWILDDITPLRQINAEVANADAYLFKPQLTYRVQRNTNTDTPLPPDEPVGQNPPDGAIIDYSLKSNANTPVVVEIFDSSNKLVRHFASDEKLEPYNEKEFNVPAFWHRPARLPSTEAGMQRFVWDLHYPTPKALNRDYPISANYMDTPIVPLGTLVLPGEYKIRLTVNNRSYEQPLTIRIDPRVKTSAEGLRRQFDLSMLMYDAMNRSFDALAEVRNLRTQLKALRERTSNNADLQKSIAALDEEAATFESATGGRRGASLSGELQSFAAVHNAASLLFQFLQDADAAPTMQVARQTVETERALTATLDRWNDFKSNKIRQLNAQLQSNNLPPVK